MSQVSLWFTDLKTTTGFRRRIQLSRCHTSAWMVSSSSSSSATSAGDIKLFPLAQGPRHYMPAGARQALGILFPYHHQIHTHRQTWGRSAARSERNACWRSCGVSVAWGITTSRSRSESGRASPCAREPNSSTRPDLG